MNKKIVKTIIYLIVIIFLCSYFIETTGYYQYNIQHQKNLTEESIKQFDFEIICAEISAETRNKLLLTQERQKMVNA